MLKKIIIYYLLGYLILSFFFSATLLKAQENKFLNLEPELIAAASCNGMIAGNSLINYESGILSEERARIMVRTTTLSLFLTAIKHQSIDHLREYQQEYDSIFQEELQRIITLVETESFDWDTQAELDVCAARVFDPLTSISKSDLEKVGIGDYFKFSNLIIIEADRLFDFYLKVIEAMK